MNTNFIFHLLMKGIKFKVDGSIQLMPIIRDGTKYERTLHNGRIPTKRMQGRRVMKPCGLSGLQETSNGNFLSPTINPNQQSLYMERIPQNTCIYENLPHKEMPSSPRNKSQFHTTIKNPKPSEIKVPIIYPSSSTLEL